MSQRAVAWSCIIGFCLLGLWVLSGQYRVEPLELGEVDEKPVGEPEGKSVAPDPAPVIQAPTPSKPESAPRRLVEVSDQDLDSEVSEIRVLVVDDAGEPISDLPVWMGFSEKGGNRRAAQKAWRRSDAKGIAVFSVDGLGTVGITSVLGGNARCVVDHVGSFEIRLAIGALRVVEGMVVDEEGEPIAGVEVHVADSNGAVVKFHPMTQSDQAGRFTILVEKRGVQYVMAVKAEDRKSLVRQYGMGREQKQLVLQLRGPRMGYRRVIVRGSNGQPIAGAHVYLGSPRMGMISTEKEGWYALAPMRTYLTNEAGEARAQFWTSPSEPLVVKAEDWGMFSGKILRWPRNSPVNNVPPKIVILGKTVVLRGAVADPLDPESSISLFVYSAARPDVPALESVAREGEPFTLKGLPLGRVEIKAISEDKRRAAYLEFTAFSDGVRRWYPTLRDASKLPGMATLIGRKGKAISSAYVEAFTVHKAGPLVESSSRCTKQGVFRVPTKGDGYWVRFRREIFPRHVVYSEEMRKSVGRTVLVDDRKAGWIDGIMQIQNLAEGQEAFVTLRQLLSKRRIRILPKNGNLVVKQLPPGEYRLSVSIASTDHGKQIRAPVYESRKIVVGPRRRTEFHPFSATLQDGVLLLSPTSSSSWQEMK